MMKSRRLPARSGRRGRRTAGERHGPIHDVAPHGWSTSSGATAVTHDWQFLVHGVTDGNRLRLVQALGTIDTMSVRNHRLADETPHLVSITGI
jgi:hypothetical protein